MQKKVLLTKITDVQKFCNAAASVRIDVTVKQGRYIIDGKSIMAMYSLDLTSPLTVEYDSPDDAEIAKFEQATAEFTVTE